MCCGHTYDCLQLGSGGKNQVMKDGGPEVMRS